MIMLCAAGVGGGVGAVGRAATRLIVRRGGEKAAAARPNNAGTHSFTYHARATHLHLLLVSHLLYTPNTGATLARPQIACQRSREFSVRLRDISGLTGIIAAEIRRAGLRRAREQRRSGRSTQCASLLCVPLALRIVLQHAHKDHRLLSPHTSCQGVAAINTKLLGYQPQQAQAPALVRGAVATAGSTASSRTCCLHPSSSQ